MKKSVSTFLLSFALAVSANVFCQVDYATDPYLSFKVKAFLKELKPTGVKWMKWLLMLLP